MAAQTYSLRRPADDRGFWQPATCEQVECRAHVSGWRTVLAANDGRCDYIRSRAGRAFTEHTEAGLTTFTFPPGQQCFNAAGHRRRVEREPLYLVQGAVKRRHKRPELWVEDFSEHLDKIESARARG